MVEVYLRIHDEDQALGCGALLMLWLLFRRTKRWKRCISGGQRFRGQSLEQQSETQPVFIWKYSSTGYLLLPPHRLSGVWPPDLQASAVDLSLLAFLVGLMDRLREVLC